MKNKALMNVDLKNLVGFVILYCINKGVSISPLKLQKLLYYIQVWHIIKFDKNPMFDELAEAWVNGPVYRSVYNTFKKKFFKNDDFAVKMNEKELSQALDESLISLKLAKKNGELLLAVLDNYSIMSDEKLVFLTHSELPWNDARKGLSPIERSENQISIDSIYNYYSSKLKK